MPTYESSGTLTTIEKSFSTPQTPDLTGLSYTLNGESISVDVVGSPGTASEEIVTQSLGGASSYDLAWNASHSDFEVVFNLSTADDQTTPTVDDLTLVGAPNAPEITVSEVSDTPDIALSWPTVDTADEYRVYRAESPGTSLGDYTQIDTTTTVDYVDTTPSIDTTYYYVVTAVNTDRGESPASNEVRARVGDGLTDQVVWDSEVEWDYGGFSSTATDGSGNLVLGEYAQDSLDFDYSLRAQNPSDESGSASASVEIRDASSGTVLASDSTGSVANDLVDTTGTFSIDIASHPDLAFEASASTTSDTSDADASISGVVDYTTQTIVSVDIGGNASDTDTLSNTYTYAENGTWDSPNWDYGATTTATKLSWTGVTYPNSGDSITVTVSTADGSSQVQVSDPAAGSGEALIEIGASDRYYVTVDMSTADETTTPAVDSLTLETHTPPTNHTLTQNQNGDGFILDWDTVAVADQYQLYRSTSTPVTPSDTLVASPTSPPYEDTNVDTGTDYYYNVRAEYTGE